MKGPQELPAFLFFQGGKPKELVCQGFILSAKPGHPSASEIRGVISLVWQHMDLMLRVKASPYTASLVKQYPEIPIYGKQNR